MSYIRLIKFETKLPYLLPSSCIYLIAHLWCTYTVCSGCFVGPLHYTPFKCLGVKQDSSNYADILFTVELSARDQSQIVTGNENNYSKNNACPIIVNEFNQKLLKREKFPSCRMYNLNNKKGKPESKLLDRFLRVSYSFDPI